MQPSRPPRCSGGRWCVGCKLVDAVYRQRVRPRLGVFDNSAIDNIGVREAVDQRDGASEDVALEPRRPNKTGVARGGTFTLRMDCRAKID